MVGKEINMNYCRIMRKIFLLPLILCFTLDLIAGPIKVKKTFPDINGYKVLKCDFHIHTVYSDGNVWPSERMVEAYTEDIDAISITDHLEYRPHKADLTNQDFNAPYNMAAEAAKRLNIINVRGAEITRETPPGHTNAIFIRDANELYNPANNSNPGAKEGYEDAVKLAHDGGAFIFYNHPYYLYNHDNITLPDQVSKLMDKGMIKGIEIINENRYIPQSFQWAKEKGLTLIASSDVHSGMGLFLSEFNLSHRPTTLVLAKERSEESIKKALEEGRTIVWYNEMLIGFEENIKAMVEGCIEMTYRFNKNALEITLVNNSPVTFNIEFLSNDELYVSQGIVLRPNTETIMSLRIRNDSASVLKGLFRVNNAWVGDKEPLVIEKTFIRNN